jgi:hypothetical protein
MTSAAPAIPIWWIVTFMSRARDLLLGLLLSAGLPVAAQAGQAVDLEAVDLELVLAGDASGSIDGTELQFQRQGCAEALTDPRVIGAIQEGAIGAIAVAYIEWAGSFSTDLVVDWQVIHDLRSAQSFAAALLSAPRRAQGFNAIGAGVALATNLIETNGYDGTRGVIDVSGDGPDIGVPPADKARDQAVALGLTINALAITSNDQSAFSNGIPLATHYADHVIGGPGAFVTVAEGMGSFREALLAKLVREISGIDPPGPRIAQRPRATPPRG